jgi:hypothetical protein
MKTKAILLMALLFLAVSLSPLKVSHAETSWSEPATVDSTDNVGMECSLALDSTGSPHISYWIYPNMDLKYIDISDGEWSIPATLDKDGIVGMYSSLALDSADNPHISYYDDTNGDLKYIRMSDGLWSEPVTLDSTGNVGRFSSLALDSADNAHISYYDYTNGDLKYVSSHPGYDVRINAWSILGEASLPITMDGIITGFNTSYLFEGLEGTHNFTLPETANDYPFAEWTKNGATIAATRTITITSGGTYNAQYTISSTVLPGEPPIIMFIAVGIAIGVVALTAGLLLYIKKRKHSSKPGICKESTSPNYCWFRSPNLFFKHPGQNLCLNPFPDPAMKTFPQETHAFSITGLGSRNLSRLSISPLSSGSSSLFKASTSSLFATGKLSSPKTLRKMLTDFTSGLTCLGNKQTKFTG